jgi:hypothetical protein
MAMASVIALLVVRPFWRKVGVLALLFGAVLVWWLTLKPSNHGNAEIAASKKENLLVQSGFKYMTVNTPKQQQAVSQLAQARVSAVKYNGKIVLRVSHCDKGQDLRNW